MSSRQATMLVADDFSISLNGKFSLSGVYTADISIPVDPTIAPQLVFVFLLEADLKEPVKSLELEILLPGSSPVRLPVHLPPVANPIPPGRTRQFLRWPQLVQSVLLRPGKIEAKIIHESGEIVVGGPWIVMATQAAVPAPPPTVQG